MHLMRCRCLRGGVPTDLRFGGQLWTSGEPDWEAKHLERRHQRLKMAGPAHHQGPINLREFGRIWVRLFIGTSQVFNYP
jgi:hypothetical protein